jgi:hypothetical protein
VNQEHTSLSLNSLQSKVKDDWNRKCRKENSSSEITMLIRWKGKVIHFLFDLPCTIYNTFLHWGSRNIFPFSSSYQFFLFLYSILSKSIRIA